MVSLTSCAVGGGDASVSRMVPPSIVRGVGGLGGPRGHGRSTSMLRVNVWGGAPRPQQLIMQRSRSYS